MKKGTLSLFSLLSACLLTVSFTSHQEANAQVAKSTQGGPSLSSDPQPDPRQTTRIEGVWQTQKEDKNARIHISRCDHDASKFCGKIVWLQSPTYEDGSPKVDRNNKDKSLQSRPLMGLNLLEGFEKISDTFWDHGTIYNPEDGDTYQCEITYINREGKERLEVHGYVGISLFGKTQTWVRAPL